MRRDPLTRRSLAPLLVLVAAIAVIAALSSGSGRAAQPVVISTSPKEHVFVPPAVMVHSTDTIRVLFRNGSTISHNMTFLSPLSGGTRTIVEPGQEDTIELHGPEPGIYRFICTIHPGMEGTLTVD